ncbi:MULTISPECIES: ATP-binding cassette domain-containing protein [unclassified Sulfuricurvum]|uniref:ABC transporter ATP-binding protein n=1 Tax=unclassified Sulfuricurvum TaxID=2632390 RepID=UPI0002996848|nr:MULTISPECIES: ATP-binding cassette domain-containing protein [unclassified Sulfuricurvum]OHD84029.1 MAG: peptide ABC transporter ATP-binding protein [Sulfuricurvum sp. RIFCSPHIGHO2_02_FULL_43_9]OHD85790.1 MAG: peptide ABC transporter ATP-binding protein [Sulfuricurvum sp. RIFCSPLOWO2_02_43_6]AFV98573.1 ABC transporter-like protein [Candidatus Sulfuricurvum sp. RIFRC-1]OHD90123.1 MAG: peptide ABC transporter ATP-binding protein [Sulfuricurvum sp. RIFCSPLOWO2_12_FULL_43_24]HBM36765.1 peptide 
MKIEALGLEHFYGHEKVLNGVDIEILPGSFTAIIGESGSGKTTLLSILSTLLQPSHGSVRYDGKTLSELGNIDHFRREHIGFVFQFHYLISYLTLRENVALAALDPTLIDPLMGSLGIERLGKRYSDEVSGGERQRAAIARALINHPSVVFADEPTGNLDTKNALGVYELFREFSHQGTGFVVASHDKKIADYADIIIEMEDGLVKQIHKQ